MVELIGRSATHALRALLELAQEPERWRSVSDLALAGDLPGPALEQLLLRLRRAGVLEARRGRHGGYRLALAPSEVSLASVLNALDGGEAAEPDLGAEADASLRVTEALRRRLRRALERELQSLTLEDLHHDLRSSRAASSDEGGLLLG